MPPRNTLPHHHHNPHNKTFPDAPADVSALLYFASLLLGLTVAVIVVVLLRQYYCAVVVPGGLRDGSSPHSYDEAPLKPPPWFSASGRVPGARRPRNAGKMLLTTKTGTAMTTPGCGGSSGDGGEGGGGGGGGEGGGLDMAAVAAPLWGYGAVYHKPGASGVGTETGEREDEGGDKKREGGSVSDRGSAA